MSSRSQVRRGVVTNLLRLGVMTNSTAVDFWFDPSCPWAWMTSRFVDEVAPHRDLDVTWRLMSLAVLNEDKDVSDHYRSFLPRAMRYARLLSAARELHGQEIIKPLYDALGEQIHPGASKDVDFVIATALQKVGLPADFARYADSDEFDAPLRASHAEGINRVGHDVGTPIIAIGEVAFFGPVISPTPRGPEALALWDGIVAVSAYDGFFELKRSRTRDPIFV
jgi:2-hydroxychromene-2-carboxylate isomerase